MTKEWAGKWALITGASAGIGVALATQLASEGTNLILTARRQDRLESLAEKLRRAHGIRAEVFAADLAQHIAPQRIYDFTKRKQVEIDLLINNAGFGQYENFQAWKRSAWSICCSELRRGGTRDKAISGGYGSTPAR